MLKACLRHDGSKRGSPLFSPRAASGFYAGVSEREVGTTPRPLFFTQTAGGMPRGAKHASILALKNNGNSVLARNLNRT